MEGRLQFKHDFTIYSGLTELKDSLNYSIRVAKNTPDGSLNHFIPILGEPVVFRYRDANGVHLVLGVGKTQSLPTEEDPSVDAEYSLIDFDALNNGLGDISTIYDDIKDVVDSLGIGTNGKVDENWEDKDPDHVKHKAYFEGEDANLLNYITILHDKIKESADNMANLVLEYDSENRKVVLKYEDGTVISEFDASVFVKDGILDRAVLIPDDAKRQEEDPDFVATPDYYPYLLFVWNTESDKDVTRIPVSQFFNIYNGISGITVEGNNISINRDRESEDFLSISANGLRLSGVQDAINAAKSSAVTECKTYTDEKISDLTDSINDVINELDADFTDAVMELSSGITRNSEKIQQNKVDVEKLKDFAEYNVGKIDGEVIATVVESNRDRIETLESKADSAAAELPNKVDKIEGKGLSTNDYTNEEKALLATVSQNAQENVIETIKVNGAALVPDVTKAVNIEVPFKSLADDEKILTLNNEGVLESMFSVDYDTNAKKIFFYGKTDQKLGEIDVTEFLIDGMIRSVNIVTEDGVKYLKFIFNTDAGNREIKIALTDLVTEYTVSGGSENYLVIDDFKIGLKVDQADYSGLASGSAVHDVDDKYSAITHSLEDRVGEGILDDSGNTISLTHKINKLDEIMDNFVDENKLEFDEDFKIAGIIGTLGTGKWKNGDVIPAGTKVMDVLKDILQQRLLPEGVQPTATIKLVNPSPVEVGTVISPVYEIRFNNGVYNYADGTTGATLIGVDSVSVILLNNGSNTPNTSTDYPNGTFQNVVATDGMNLSVMANISYSSSYVPKDNLGTDVPEKKIPDGMLEFVRSENTVTSYRPMFYGSLRDGDIADYDNITSQEVLTLLSKATGETVNRVVVNDEAEVVVIMIPVMSNKEIKKIIDTDSGFDLMDVFERHQTVVKTYEGEENATTSYYVYVYDPKTQIGENVYRIIYNEN